MFENNSKNNTFLDLLDAYKRDIDELFPVEVILHFQDYGEDGYTFECTPGNFELGVKDPPLEDFRQTIYKLLGGETYYFSKDEYITFTVEQFQKMKDLAKKKKLHIEESAKWCRIYVNCDDIEDLIYQVEALLINIKNL